MTMAIRRGSSASTRCEGDCKRPSVIQEPLILKSQELEQMSADARSI